MFRWVFNEQDYLTMDWSNYKFTNLEFKLEIGFDLYGFPRIWRPVHDEAWSTEKFEINKERGPFDELRDFCDSMRSNLNLYSEHTKLVAFMMQSMSPFILQMRLADMRSRNVSYDLAEQESNLAKAKAAANYATEWIRKRKLLFTRYHSAVWSALNFVKNSRNRDINSSIVEMKDEEITDEDDEIALEMTPKYEKLTCKITSEITSKSGESTPEAEMTSESEEVTSTAIKTTSESDEKPVGTSKAICKIEKKASKTVETIYDAVATTSGIKQATCKIGEMASKNLDLVKSSIKCLIVISNPVQHFNKLVLQSTMRLLKDVCDTRKSIGKVKQSKLLTHKEFQSCSKDIEACFDFLTKIKYSIMNTSDQIDEITEYMKLNETKLLSGIDETFQRLIRLECNLRECLTLFKRIAANSDKAVDLVAGSYSEGIIKASTQQSTSVSTSVIDNLQTISDHFRNAWNACDAYADMLHCLSILLAGDIEDFEYIFTQEANLIRSNTSNIDDTSSPQVEEIKTTTSTAKAKGKRV
ncbi:unnamed protein product [Onchocerca ochengi]|uniref:DUF4456 domain-containing protein n=1 Tax=Onchocerca ochengi TaxID=42157 RepID=A0A182EGQ5_ONCOC|nr:unnamed protein product [Onchocerca ochengi]